MILDRYIQVDFEISLLSCAGTFRPPHWFAYCPSPLAPSFKYVFFNVYLFILRERERERESVSGGGAERGRERESQAGSSLSEAAALAALAGSVFLAQLMIFLISVVSSIFCGHLGKVELDAVTLAVSVVNVIGISVGTDLASACDRLMSQSFRGILILMLCCFPCWAIFINTDRILLLLKQEPEVSRIAQIYVMIFIRALPAAFLFQLQTRYLQSQAGSLIRVFQ
uniref:Solute carrier family 47 member 2 n=1 Tax=Lynx canadensis TaxID=61383 RepID=A0A667ID34_LYNCA